MNSSHDKNNNYCDSSAHLSWRGHAMPVSYCRVLVAPNEKMSGMPIWLSGLLSWISFNLSLLVLFGSLRFRMVPSGLALTPSLVWCRMLLLYIFHKELVIWEKISLGFCQRDKRRLRFFMYNYCWYIDIPVNPKKTYHWKSRNFCHLAHIMMIKTSHRGAMKNRKASSLRSAWSL